MAEPDANDGLTRVVLVARRIAVLAGAATCGLFLAVWLVALILGASAQQAALDGVAPERALVRELRCGMLVGLSGLGGSVDNVSLPKGYSCKHFALGLPQDAEDQSLTALFQHVAAVLAEDEPISMDDVLTVGFETELGDGGEYRGSFIVVFSRDGDSASTVARVP